MNAKIRYIALGAAILLLLPPCSHLTFNNGELCLPTFAFTFISCFAKYFSQIPQSVVPLAQTLYIVCEKILFLSIQVALVLCVIVLFIIYRRKRAQIASLQRDLSQRCVDVNLLTEKLVQNQNLIDDNCNYHNRILILQRQNLELCLRYFKTLDVYQELLSIDKTKVKKEKKLSICYTELHACINEVFAIPIQDLHSDCSELTANDLYYTILFYLGFSDTTISLCMGGISLSAITQCKHRIKTKMSTQLFNSFFS